MDYLKFSVLLITIWLISSCSCSTIKHEEYKIKIVHDGLLINRDEGSRILIRPEFTVIYSAQDPEKALRYGNHGYEMKAHENLGIKYKVPTWGKTEKLDIDPDMHVMDGFDPETDRIYEEGRTANMFLAGETKKLVAVSQVTEEGSVQWTFPENDYITLDAIITVENGYPSIYYEFSALKEGYYSVGFTGAPEYDLADCEEIWQANIWAEKRFPNLPYLSESYRCQVPATFISKSGLTYGLVGAPEYESFMPIPKPTNSQFGLMVRNEKGLAQSTVFSPVLGGINSKMANGDTRDFRAYVYVKQGDIHRAFEECGTDIYQFRDIRENTTVTLNKTFENMVDFCLSPYGEFNESLRGSNYSTDVPGAVKNISGLHPLSIAVVTDNPVIYKERARPMLEYGLTRERFLFATDPDLKRDGTSAKLNGPGVPMSDLSTTYTFSGKRMSHFIDVAKRIYDEKVNRSLNLDAMLYGHRWQNAMGLYRATGESHYLDEAIEKADQYLADRVLKEQTNFSDPQSRGLFFWTSYANQFMELYLMYLTSGEKRFLDAAHDGARHYARFCWLSPMIPEGEVTVNKGGVVPRYRSSEQFITMQLPEERVEAWRVSEQGLTPESAPTCNGHRGIFMTHHAPFMMRIAAETGDKFLHDIARSAVIGRYENFPGYHINAGRTTAFEKHDFPLRPFLELNGHTSMHFNHPWSHVAMLMDYMMADVYYQSDRQIDMNPEYAEGYAYCRSLIYGANKGRFYEDKGVVPYMPKQLVDPGDDQLNYIAARGNEKLYVAFTNQSEKRLSSRVRFDPDKAGLQSDQTYKCQVWMENKPAGEITLESGEISIEVAPKGITAIAIEGVSIQTSIQERFYTTTDHWKKDFSTVGFHEDNAVIFNMGMGLVSAYFMTKTNDSIFKQVTVRYRMDNGSWQSVTRQGYPYEFTVEVDDTTQKIEYVFEGLTPEGQIQKSEFGVLRK